MRPSNATLFKRFNAARKKRVAQKQAAICDAGSAEFMLPSVADPMTEFEVQSNLYQTLSSLGFKVRGELRTRCGTARFDLILFSDCGKPTMIIEVKRCSKDYRTKINTKQTRREQLTKYKEFGIPVRVVNGAKEAQNLIDELTGPRTIAE